MKKTDYLPISCDFHDELQLIVLRKMTVPIHYRKANGDELNVEASIVDLYTREKEEFLLLPNGEEIRLDRLISVNGIALSQYC